MKPKLSKELKQLLQLNNKQLNKELILSEEDIIYLRIQYKLYKITKRRV